jgi:hypothetical protein
MNRLEFQDRLNFCRRELEALQAVQIGCRSCAQFDALGRACKKYGAVPEGFIAQGCDEWEYDDIPF